MNQGPVVNSITLERMKYIVLHYLNERLVDDFAIPRDVDVMADAILGAIVIRIRQDILGRELERIEVRYPADWWQAFKARWFPKWALIRWPVKETVKELIARELYPKMAMPDREPRLNLWVSGAD